jgi:hypothetical protein
LIVSFGKFRGNYLSEKFSKSDHGHSSPVIMKICHIFKTAQSLCCAEMA